MGLPGTVIPYLFGIATPSLVGGTASFLPAPLLHLCAPFPEWKW